jgi:hypothetical protein
MSQVAQMPPGSRSCSRSHKAAAFIVSEKDGDAATMNTRCTPDQFIVQLHITNDPTVYILRADIHSVQRLMGSSVVLNRDSAVRALASSLYLRVVWLRCMHDADAWIECADVAPGHPGVASHLLMHV